MKYTIPNVGDLELNQIVLDLNGTLSVYGKIKESTEELLKKLVERKFRIILLTGDHRGTAQEFADTMGLELIKVNNGDEKKEAFQKVNNNKTVSIGNARIDIGTFDGAALSIATLQSEGIHTGILKYCDILVLDIDDALKFILDSSVLEATMRI